LHFKDSSDDDDEKPVHSGSTLETVTKEVEEMDLDKQEFIRDEIIKVEQTLTTEIESLSHQIEAK
jgi:hypothetical protein